MLVEAFKQFGSKSRVPSLWLYAKNDSFFDPAVVERMRAAFLDGGGDAKLVLFDPIGEDGHRMFGLGTGRMKWPGNGRLLAIPQAANLGAAGCDRADVETQGPGTQARIRRRLRGSPARKGPREVVGRLHVWGWGHKALGDARNAALNGCKRERPREECAIVMENNRWLGDEN
jgi:hypothetical protein